MSIRACASLVGGLPSYIFGLGGAQVSNRVFKSLSVAKPNQINLSAQAQAQHIWLQELQALKSIAHPWESESCGFSGCPWLTLIALIGLEKIEVAPLLRVNLESFRGLAVGNGEKMDGTRWMKPVRVPSPGIALSCDATFRHRHEVASLAPRVSAVGGKSATETSSTSASSSMPSRQSYVFPIKTMWLWPRSQGPSVGKESKSEDKEDAEERETATQTQRVNWVQNILRVGLIWAGKQEKATGYSEEVVEEDELCLGQDCVQSCQGCANRGEVADRMEFDTESFSRLLRRVTFREALLFGKVALLSSLAYDIPKIKVVFFFL